MSKIEVVRRIKIGRNAASRSRRVKIFTRNGGVMAQFVLPAGDVVPWHAHGSRELLGFLARGRLRLEYWSKKSGAVDLVPGDFFRIPRRLIHRDVNLSKYDPVVVVSFYLGKGPVVVNVEENSEGLEGLKESQRR